MDPILFAPRFYGLTTGADKFVETLQRHVKDNLIQIDFKVKRNILPKFETTTKLAPLIVYWLEQKKMKPAELARRMNVSPAFISLLANGKTGLSIGALERLIQSLDISPATFFSVVWDKTSFAKPIPISKEVKKAV
jgi:DNA-binding Xre family transcriptional regulator